MKKRFYSQDKRIPLVVNAMQGDVDAQLLLTDEGTPLPCPFCGHEVEVCEKSCGHLGSGQFTATFAIQCPECRVGFTHESKFVLEKGKPKFIVDGYNEVLKKWNMRVKIDPIPTVGDDS